MVSFYEITDPKDGEIILRIAVLTETEKRQIVESGYRIERRALHRRMIPFLVGKDD